MSDKITKGLRYKWIMNGGDRKFRKKDFIVSVISILKGNVNVKVISSDDPLNEEGRRFGAWLPANYPKDKVTGYRLMNGQEKE